jgi:hypothetical protein
MLLNENVKGFGKYGKGNIERRSCERGKGISHTNLKRRSLKSLRSVKVCVLESTGTIPQKPEASHDLLENGIKCVVLLFQRHEALVHQPHQEIPEKRL